MPAWAQWLRSPGVVRFSFAVLAAAATGPAVAQTVEQTFNFSYPYELNGLDPHAQNQGWALGIVGNLYEGLVRHDEELRVEPALAEKWSRVESDVWRFELRQGVTFHDGAAFTADDVVYSFERARQPGSAVAAVLRDIDEVRQIDDHTVEILTNGPNPVLPASRV